MRLIDIHLWAARPEFNTGGSGFPLYSPDHDNKDSTILNHGIKIVGDNNVDARVSVETGSDEPTPDDAAPVAPAAEGKSSRSEWERRYRTRLLLTDAVAIVGAVTLAQFLRFGSSPTSPAPDFYYVTAYSALIAVLWLIALAGFRTRSPRCIGLGLLENRRVIAASFATFGAIAMAELLLKLEISRGYLAVALPAGVLGLLLSRWIWREDVSRKRIAGAFRTSVLAVGEKEVVANLVSELMDDPKNGYHVVGVCITDYGTPRGEHLIVNERMIPIMGGAHYALQAICDSGADTVAIAGTADFGVNGLRRLIWELEPMDVDLMLSPGVMDVGIHRLVMRPISRISLVHVDKPLYQGTKRFQKRAFDMCFAFVALVAVLPILIVTAIAVKISSKGPVLYRSERIGIDGKPFTIFKFRTMVEDADKQMERLLLNHRGSSPIFFKMKNDPRVTPVGRLLRRYSIDELPQFINVLRQDMSVVGPRPQVRREVEAYDCDVQRRLLVKPGITGLWQVSGRSNLPLEKAVGLDLSYVDNWSMFGDLIIIARTVKAVFASRGAY